MGNWFHDLGLFVFAVIAHWQALATGGIVTASVGVYERRKNTNLSWQSYAFIIGAFCLYSFFAAWQDEHRNTLHVESDKSSLSSQLGGCQSDLQSTKSTLRDKETLADSFQKAFTSVEGPQLQQQANISTCITTLAKMNPKLHQEVKAFSIPYGISNTDGTNRRVFAEILITVNQLGLRPFGNLHCDQAFTMARYPTLPVIPPHNFEQQFTVPSTESKTDYLIDIQTTGAVWGPTTPIYFPIYSQAESVGNCTFSLIE
jgi:hypothetical protein